MALTAQQKIDCASFWVNASFVVPNVVASFSTTDIQSAVTAFDGALDTTLSAAVTAVGGGMTVINGLASIIPAPFSTASAAQKTLLLCYVLMKRAGLI